MQPRVCVFGPGALGMYFATRLARQGYNPLLVGRKKSSLLSNACMKKTLRVTAAPGVDLTAYEQDVWFSEGIEGVITARKELDDLFAVPKPFDLAVALVKHKDTQAVGQQIHMAAQAGLFTKEAVILSLQNGLGNLEVIKEQLSEEAHAMKLAQGVTYMAVNKLSDDSIQINALGKTAVPWIAGSESEALPTFAEAVDAEVVDAAAIESIIWTKLLVNCVVNPITALMNQRNTCIVEKENLSRLGGRVAEEVYLVSKAKGITLNLDGLSAADFALKIAKQTGKNRSSMLTDVLNKRKTEIDAMNGYLISEERLEISVPYSMALYDLVKGLD